MEKRICFKRFVLEEDFSYFLKLTTNEELMVMNYGRIFTREESEGFYKKMMEQNSRTKDFGYFKVFKKNEDTFIGLAAISVNNDCTEVEIEYLLLPEYWGNRYGTEIAENLLEKIKKISNISKVTAIINPDNIRSKKILLKNGFILCKTYKVDDGKTAQMFIKELHN
ncbi:N-acetyltransferase [Clostridiaceae bacterium 14S0207]|nr:N-acetyltransferase [Clostridiaceae bacterium 14S0207]